MRRFLIYILICITAVALPQTKKPIKKTTTSQKKTTVKKKKVVKKTTQKKKTVKKKTVQKKTVQSQQQTKKSTQSLTKLRDANVIKAPDLNGDDDELEENNNLNQKNKNEFEVEEVDGEKLLLFPDGSPYKTQNIINEDTSSIDDNIGDIEFIETEEEIKIDSEWVKVYEDHEWMQNESTNRVNPYNLDPSKIEPIPLLIIDTAKGRNWSKPLHRCYKTSDFGPRWGRFHYGVDLGLTTGDSIYSAFDGLVRVVGFDRRGYGNFIVVRHYNGLETVYGHLSRTHSKIGDYVKSGELIGFGGSTGRSTGPHLHFELRYAGNPIDPKFFFDFDNCQLIKETCTITKDNFKYLQLARKVYYHKVKPGETLYKIAKKYHVSVAKLRKLNRLSSKSTIRAGRRLRIN